MLKLQSKAIMTLTTPVLIIAFIIILVAFVSLILWIAKLQKRVQKLCGGKQASDLEEVIIALHSELEAANKFNQELLGQLQNLESRLKRKIEHVRTIRFNPFQDQGGNHSFATAFLDESGDGVVLSSLYSRDKVSVYAKPVSARASAYELSQEEQDALGRPTV